MGRWPRGMPLFWYLDASNLDPADVPAIEGPIGQGIESWNGVCGVTIARTSDPSQAQLIVRFVADLNADPTVPPDPSNAAQWLAGNELGLTDMPVSFGNIPAAQLAGVYCTMRLNPHVVAGWTALKLDEVTIHEGGHFLGFDHPQDGIVSCMSRFLNQRVSTQTPYDVGIAQAVYGVPSAPPPAAPANGPVSPPADVSPQAQEPHNVNVLGLILTRSIPTVIAGQIAERVRAQLAQGTPLDNALRSELAALSTNITDPTLRTEVGALLNALLTFGEFLLGKGLDTFAGTSPAGN